MKGFIKMDKKTRLRLYLEISKYSLDIPKLIVGGIIISGIVGLNFNKTSLLIYGILASLMMLSLGIVLFIMGSKK